MNFHEGEIIGIDKPYGMSSFKALAHVRWHISRRIGGRIKVGHAGTLDPLATGVLLICTGRATKRIEELQRQAKEYVATLQLGATTPSFDMEHTVDATYPTGHITRDLIAEALGAFVGEIEQVPPAYSACKVNGRRAYRMTRVGQDVDLAAKRVVVHGIDVLGFDPGTMRLEVRVTCGKGTYIRSLARDLGLALGSGAYLTALRRTRVGDIGLEDCVSLDGFRDWLDAQTVEQNDKRKEET